MMYAETFLEQFVPLAYGPGGVHKLRELVLRLGLGGRLRTDMDALFKWRMFQINDIADCFMGNSISAAEKSQRYEGLNEGLPYIATKDVDGWHGGINYDSGVKIPYDQPRMRVAPAGSVLICAEGGSAGRKIGVLKKDVNFGNKLICCVPNSGIILQEYLFRLFQSPAFYEAFRKEMTGIIGGISLSKFKSLQIHVPELHLQHEIVAKVGELMALCDKLEARQTKGVGLKHAAAASVLHHLTEAKRPEDTADRWLLLAPRFSELFDDLETINVLRDHVLELATTGKLITRASADDVQDLISRIEGERSAQNQSKKRGPTEHYRVDLDIFPSHWAVLPLSSLAWASNYGASNRCDTSGNGEPVLRIPNISNGSVRLDDLKFAINPLELSTGEEIKPGDLLIVRTNGSQSLIGRGAVVSSEFDVPTYFASYLIRFRLCQPESLWRWINTIWHSPFIRSHVLRESATTAGQYNLSKSKLAQFPIPLPPEKEIEETVAMVHEFMALCDKLEEQVREVECLNAELMDSLVRTLTETDADGGGMAADPASFTEEATWFTTAEPATGKLSVAPQRKSPHTANVVEAESGAVYDGMHSLNTKFQEAVLVGAIVRAFFEVGGYPIGNFRLQKAVYFACRRMGGHLGEMAYLKKAAGPYNPSMKYSDGIAMAKQRNWLRVARGRFGFGHVPGLEADEMDGWIAMYGYGEPVRWVAEHFRFKRNDEWETLATVDYVVEHLQSLGIRPAAAQILQYIRADDEWYPKIEKLGLTEMSVTASVVELEALFGTTDEGDSA